MKNKTNTKVFQNYLRKLMYMAIIIETALALPQLFEIYRNRSSENVSLLTWAGYELLSVVWLAYSISTKDKPIILYSSISFITQGAVIILILVFR